jgi:hypothetical protein
LWFSPTSVTSLRSPTHRPPAHRLLAASAAALTAVGSVALVSSSAAGAAPRPHQNPVVLFGSDGMRPDLMQKYAGRGLMPTYAALMRTGATGDNGLTQGFPPNTGQGWYTLATGAGPGVHGSTNNTFFDNRQPFTSSTSFSFHGNGASPGSDLTNVLEAQSVASSAELAGKKVAQLEWTGGLNANINGPTVDYATFYSGRGEVTYGNLFTMQPFQDDYVDTFTLTGAQVWALLQQQLAPGTGGIMQVSGLRFTYSGSTITAVTQTDGTPIPNDTTRTYTGTAKFVHDRRRRRVHGAGGGRQHRPDGGRRVGAAGDVCRHPAQPLHLPHGRPHHEELMTDRGRRVVGRLPPASPRGRVNSWHCRTGHIFGCYALPAPCWL